MRQHVSPQVTTPQVLSVKRKKKKEKYLNTKDITKHHMGKAAKPLCVFFHEKKFVAPLPFF